MPSRPSPTDGDRCPIAFALDGFGDRWTLLVVRDVLFKQKRHYNAFLNGPEGISTNILANRLSALTAQGFLEKRKDPAAARRWEYRPTQKTVALLPVLIEMVVWSAQYDPQPDAPSARIVGAPEDLLARWSTDRDAVLKDIRHRLIEEGIAGA